MAAQHAVALYQPPLLSRNSSTAGHALAGDGGTMEVTVVHLSGRLVGGIYNQNEAWNRASPFVSNRRSKDVDSLVLTACSPLDQHRRTALRPIIKFAINEITTRRSYRLRVFRGRLNAIPAASCGVTSRNSVDDWVTSSKEEEEEGKKKLEKAAARLHGSWRGDGILKAGRFGRRTKQRLIVEVFTASARYRYDSDTSATFHDRLRITGARAPRIAVASIGSHSGELASDDDAQGAAPVVKVGEQDAGLAAMATRGRVDPGRVDAEAAGLKKSRSRRRKRNKSGYVETNSQKAEDVSPTLRGMREEAAGRESAANNGQAKIDGDVVGLEIVGLEAPAASASSTGNPRTSINKKNRRGKEIKKQQRDGRVEEEKKEKVGEEVKAATVDGGGNTDVTGVATPRRPGNLIRLQSKSQSGSRLRFGTARSRQRKVNKKEDGNDDDVRLGDVGAKEGPITLQLQKDGRGDEGEKNKPGPPPLDLQDVNEGEPSITASESSLEDLELPSVSDDFKERRRRGRAKMITEGKVGDSLGNPLGRKVLGSEVMKWLSKGMKEMAADVACGERGGCWSEEGCSTAEAEAAAAPWASLARTFTTISAADLIQSSSVPGLELEGPSFLDVADKYFVRIPMPSGKEDLCAAVSTHYSTVLDHFQRELGAALRFLQQEGVVDDWRETRSWMMLKQWVKTEVHRNMSRKCHSLTWEADEEVGIVPPHKIPEIQSGIDKFVDNMLMLLGEERDAELAAGERSMQDVTTIDEAGMDNPNDTLRHLTVASSTTGLGGMHLVTLRVGGEQTRLPSTRIAPGDMIRLLVESNKTRKNTRLRTGGSDSSSGEGGSVESTVSSSTSSSSSDSAEAMEGTVFSFGEDGQSLTMIVPSRYGDPKFSQLFGKSVRVDRVQALADGTTYERNCEALRRLKRVGLKKNRPAARVVALLFGEYAKKPTVIVGDPHTSSGDKLVGSVWGGDLGGGGGGGGGAFDASQLMAIDRALDPKVPLVVIQGPPGTGKTTVVAEIIARAVQRGEKVLATAPTNAAVDNMVAKLVSMGLDKIVRIGNPARIAPEVGNKSVDLQVDSILAGFRRDVSRRRSDLRSDLRQCGGDPDLEAGLRKMLKQLAKALKEKEKEVVDQLLSSAQVILCTNTSAGDSLVQRMPAFDLVLVDEAGQAMEPSTWIPILQGKRTVLAGDTAQLAPMILSREAALGGLGVSLMERASTLYGGALGCMLTVQYRMNTAIANWASMEMYNGKLESSPLVANEVLATGSGSQPQVRHTWATTAPMVLLDTRLPRGSLMPGCEEALDPVIAGSLFNDGEVDIVIEHVRSLLAAGVRADTIAIQSPYMAQVHLLQNRFDELGDEARGIEVASIDSFQGREADAVIISMVRSNTIGIVGFLGDNRRMNVAVTRARKHVCIVCDSTTVGQNPFLLRLLQHIRSVGIVKSAGTATAAASTAVPAASTSRASLRTTRLPKLEPKLGLKRNRSQVASAVPEK